MQRRLEPGAAKFSAAVIQNHANSAKPIVTHTISGAVFANKASIISLKLQPLPRMLLGQNNETPKEKHQMICFIVKFLTVINISSILTYVSNLE